MTVSLLDMRVRPPRPRQAPANPPTHLPSVGKPGPDPKDRPAESRPQPVVTVEAATCWGARFVIRQPTQDSGPQPTGQQPERQRRRGAGALTVTFHALVDEPVQQGPAVVAERGAGVRVDLELVFAPGVLRPRARQKGPGSGGRVRPHAVGPQLRAQTRCLMNGGRRTQAAGRSPPARGACEPPT